MRLSRKLRKRYYYSVPEAGKQAGYSSRAESYRAAARGDIPTEKDGRLLLVPRKRWDAQVKRLLRGPRTKSRRRKSIATEPSATTAA